MPSDLYPPVQGAKWFQGEWIYNGRIVSRKGHYKERAVCQGNLERVVASQPLGQGAPSSSGVSAEQALHYPSPTAPTLGLVSDFEETRQAVLRYRWRKVVGKLNTVQRRRALAKAYLDCTAPKTASKKRRNRCDTAKAVCAAISTLVKFVWRHKQLRGATLSVLGSYIVFGRQASPEAILSYVY